MQIQYVIINFVILALILFLFARKMISRIFKTRYERVKGEFDEIDEAENILPPAQIEFVPTRSAPSASPVVESAKAAKEEKLAQIKGYENRERHLLHEKMIKASRKELLNVLKNNVETLFAAEPYHSAIRAYEAELIDDILTMIKLTPGDKNYLRQHGVLYVTLTSAFPLDEALVKKVDETTTRLVETVGGKISLWVLQDSSLIAGLKLKVGDTVYDGTVREALYRFKNSILRDVIENDDSTEELTKEFFEKATNFKSAISTYQLGRVLTVSDGICWMEGLADIMYGEVVEFERGERGMVLDIQQNKIGCVVFGSFENLESGAIVRRVGRIASVPVGEAMLGRVVDALGKAIDGEGIMWTKERRPIEFSAPGILDRAPVNEPLHTGIKAIDALIPIGKGQRELIIGDRQTGKSSIAIDTIINQKGKNTICIYVAIAQKETSIAEIRERLKAQGALDYTIIVAAPASGSAALQYIAPFSGTAMAEYFMYKGKDVLIIYDDLSKHAVAYRELSLLLHRPSGREAYPGDIFYLHSRLLERAAHLSDELGGGSITALPMIETLGGDISAYIPTNVISITDGQIFLETELFNEGQRPAINVSLSVSRVGGAAQTKLLKQVSSNLRARLAQYRELAEFTQFGAEVDEETKKALKAGKLLTEALKQGRYHPIPDHLQALLLFAVTEGYANNTDANEMSTFESELYEYFENNEAEIINKLKSGNKMDQKTKNELKAALDRFLTRG